jgi:hypothetical protein
MKITSDILDHVRDIYTKRREPESLRPLAAAYWRTLLGLALLAVAGSILWGVVMLFSVLDDLGTSPQATLPTAAFNRAALDSIVSQFTARQKALQDMETNPPTAIPDPSK